MPLNLETLYRSELDNKFHYKDLNNEDTILDEMFPIEIWDSPEAFKFANIRGYEPMTAKELETEEQQDLKLNDPSYILEEKFDGTRALVYFLSQPVEGGEDCGYCRVFSRRISKKTGFYVENTDSLPHIREIDIAHQCFVMCLKRIECPVVRIPGSCQKSGFQMSAVQTAVKRAEAVNYHLQLRAHSVVVQRRRKNNHIWRNQI